MDTSFPDPSFLSLAERKNEVKQLAEALGMCEMNQRSSIRNQENPTVLLSEDG
jgi:DNA-binding Xre family transcriptional regulator